MKVEFELHADADGAYIKFKHHDKDQSLEQQVLKIFIDAAKDGLVLKNTGGYIESGCVKSWDSYEIRVKK